tara:strand:- start:213 stop:551 length:339 start_codon:yes stop_codon:yes gene_type:complete
MYYTNQHLVNARKILTKIRDKGLEFDIECDGDDLVELHTSIDSAIKHGIDQVEECVIYVWSVKEDQDGKKNVVGTIGHIIWNNCNDADECIADYTMSLDDYLGEGWDRLQKD